MAYMASALIFALAFIDVCHGYEVDGLFEESISAGRLLLISSSREMDTLLVRCCSVSLGSEVLELTSTPNSLATVCLKPSRWLSLHSIEVC